MFIWRFAVQAMSPTGSVNVIVEQSVVHQKKNRRNVQGLSLDQSSRCVVLLNLVPGLKWDLQMFNTSLDTWDKTGASVPSTPRFPVIEEAEERHAISIQSVRPYRLENVKIQSRYDQYSSLMQSNNSVSGNNLETTSPSCRQLNY